MLDQEIKNRLDRQDEILEKIYISVEKTRRYFFWTMILSLVVFVLPLLGLLVVIPRFVETLTAGLGGL